ncbi:hypothetical protein [Herbaspirillum seropedicae]|uniref:hypothetical protein n=1 Tax=Herbaspirillum seropedicae TaxID=964 RepID=UPI003FCE6783
MSGRYIVQMRHGFIVDIEYAGRYATIEEARQMAKSLIGVGRNEGVVIVNEDDPREILETVAHGAEWPL